MDEYVANQQFANNYQQCDGRCRTCHHRSPRAVVYSYSFTSSTTRQTSARYHCGAITFVLRWHDIERCV